tara:strand:+ start:849 stop:1526 length:678 start_codon:yes stop_codon:yes gene_type:complete
MKKLMLIMFLMVSTVYANDIYVTQSGATLDLDILQDGQNNTIGSSTTSSSVIGATTNFDIKQVGNSNVITFDINGANYTGTWDITGNSNNIDFNCDSTGNNSSCGTATANITWTGNSSDIDLDIGETSAAGNATVNITGASGSDSNVIAASIDGTSVILTLSVNGDTNNYLIDIDGNGDVNGHTLIHSHTGGIADVDITQSGVYDNMLNLTTSGDNHDIDIIQRD